MAASKWADYLISAVRYDSDKAHIETVRVHPDLGDTVGAASEWTRTKVVTTLEGGKTVCTIVKGTDGKWSKGADVHIVTVNDVNYIRTDANSIARDNLGSLPTF